MRQFRRLIAQGQPSHWLTVQDVSNEFKCLKFPKFPVTKRAALPHPNSSSRPSSFPSTQLSLYIGIGQTVCFTMAGQPKEEANAQQGSHEEVVTVPKSNLSFIVGLARRHRKPLKSSETGDDEAKQQVLHSISVLDLEQYHAITERYSKNWLNFYLQPFQVSFCHSRAGNPLHLRMRIWHGQLCCRSVQIWKMR